MSWPTHCNYQELSGGLLPNFKTLVKFVLLLSIAFFTANCGTQKAMRTESTTLSSNGFSEESDTLNDTSDDLGGVLQLSSENIETTFASINTNIIQPKCSVCHSEPTPSAGLSLETYEQIVAAVDKQAPGLGLIMQRSSATDRTIMPPAPYLPLSITELEVIQAWVAAGALNN